MADDGKALANTQIVEEIMSEIVGPEHAAESDSTTAAAAAVSECLVAGPLGVEDASFDSAYVPVISAGKANSVGKEAVEYMEVVEVERSNLLLHLQC